MKKFGEGKYHFEKQIGLEQVRPTYYNSDYKGKSTPRGYVASYDIEKTPIQHEIFTHSRNMGMIALYQIKNENLEKSKLTERFEKFHHYIKPTHENSVDFCNYDEYAKKEGKYFEKSSWVPSLGKKGCFMSIIRNEGKRNELGSHYLMLYTTTDNMSRNFYEHNKSYDKNVKFLDYLNIDSKYNMMSHASYENNTRLAYLISEILNLKIDSESDSFSYVNKELQQDHLKRGIPSLYHFINVLAPSSDGKYINYYNYTSPNLRNVKKSSLKEICHPLHHQYTKNKRISKINENDNFHVLLGGHDSKTFIVHNKKEKQDDFYDLFTPISDSERKVSHISSNDFIIGKTKNNNDYRCISTHLDNVYDENEYKKFKFENELMKIV